MKECTFTPTAEEAQEIREAMDHRHIQRVSEYVRMAVMQLVRRDRAAREKGSKIAPGHGTGKASA